MPQAAKLTLNLDAVVTQVSEASERGMKLWMEHVLKESREVVPHEEGTLERSGTPDVERTADKIVGCVSYTTPYAVYQHEMLTLHHDAGRTAKYLERPMVASRQVGLALVAAEIRRAL